MSTLTERTPAELDHTLAACSIQIAQNEAYRKGFSTRLEESADEAERAHFRARLVALSEKLEDLYATRRELDAEWERRGGWNRVYAVAGGHIHRHTACRNGYRSSTQWFWLTEQSRRSWEDIMADAGERMCSFCFPSAPSDYRTRRSTLRDPVDMVREENRARREAARQTKLAVAEAKKVYDPVTGEQVRTFDGDLIKTERSCQSEIVDDLFWSHLAHERGMGQRARELADHARVLAIALAAKRGGDAEALLTTCDRKARAV